MISIQEHRRRYENLDKDTINDELYSEKRQFEFIRRKYDQLLKETVNLCDTITATLAGRGENNPYFLTLRHNNNLMVDHLEKHHNVQCLDTWSKCNGTK